MRKYVSIALIMFFATFAAAGTISGTITAPGGGFGIYVVLAISPDVLLDAFSSGDSLDLVNLLMSMPRTQLFMPGPYTIEGDFTNFMPYMVCAFKLESMSIPEPGSPMGLCSTWVWIRDGNATDVNVELLRSKDISGYITYDGHFPGARLEVTNIMAQPAEVETTYMLWTRNYRVKLNSGFKTLFYYIDKDYDGVYEPEHGETGTEFSRMFPSGWGNYVFIGGGGYFGDGMDVTIETAGISEKNDPDDAQISLAPFGNAFRYVTKEDAVLTITDVAGKILTNNTVHGSGYFDFNDNLPNGMYFAHLCTKTTGKTSRVILIR